MQWSDEGSPDTVTTSPATRTVGPTTTTAYTVTSVSDSSGCATPGTASGSATVTVNALATAVVRSADSAAICPSGSTPIHADLTGVGPWSVTWYDGTSYTTHSSVSTSPDTLTASPSSATTYTVTAVSDARCGAGTPSGSATVTVAPSGVTINSNPSSTTNSIGETATFTVSATAGNATYQWYYSTNGFTTSNTVTGGSGGTSASYTTPALALADSGNQYECIVTSGCDASMAASAVATLTVVPGNYSSRWPAAPGAPSRPGMKSTMVSTMWPRRLRRRRPIRRHRNRQRDHRDGGRVDD